MFTRVKTIAKLMSLLLLHSGRCICFRCFITVEVVTSPFIVCLLISVYPHSRPKTASKKQNDFVYKVTHCIER